jgi:uncharacterized protein (TIGR03067 family)
MRAHALFVLAAGMSLAADGAKDDAITLEQTKLDGTWVVESIVRDPKERGPGEGQGIRCAITGEKVVFTFPGQDKPAGSFLIRIDPTRKPKALDIREGEPPSGKSVNATRKGPPVLAIYELDGDTLRVCWAPLEKRERPKEFAAKPGSNHSLVVLKRQKP